MCLVFFLFDLSTVKLRAKYLRGWTRIGNEWELARSVSVLLFLCSFNGFEAARRSTARRQGKLLGFVFVVCWEATISMLRLKQRSGISVWVFFFLVVWVCRSCKKGGNRFGILFVILSRARKVVERSRWSAF